ncbi:AAA family ATPase [Actinomadura coerulea]|uniref:AAA family ATPase n=1 Tax=Actinomadura coerulea TaxID=46159 RepID=UPI00343A0E1B
MRIERLDLTAYGAFDGHSLHDLGAPGVHLVYGPNEAGKSTALSALDELLYGISHHSRYAFRHSSRTRLGARLSAADGVALEIVRRKRLKDGLVDGDGEPISDEVFAAFLGGIDRRTFTTEFALNSDELRRGGALLASGEGDMAQLLAAARSGMRLNAVLARIEARQRELFLPQGRRPAINAALGRLKEVRQKANDVALRPERYQAVEKSVAEAEVRLAEIDEVLRASRRLREARRRLSDSLPALAQCHDLEQRIEEITAQGPIAPDDIREQLPALLNERGKQEVARSTNAEHLGQVERRLADVGNDDSLLRYAPSIEQLTKGSEAIRDELNRRDSTSEEMALKRAETESRLRTVHPHATLADERLYRIPGALRREGQKLRDDGQTFRRTLEHARATLERGRLKREQLTESLGALPTGEDISQLKNAHSAIPAGLPEELARAEVDEKKQDRRFHEARNRIDLPELSPADVLTLWLPGHDQVADAVRTFQDLERRLRDRTGELDSTQQRLAKQRRQLDRLVTDDAPPTHEQLRARRDERDELLARLPDDPSVMARLGETVRLADDTADRMLRHSETVNKRADLTREIAELEADVSDLQAAVEDVAADQALHQQRWEALWSGYPATVPGITRGTKVLDDFESLQAAARDLQEKGIDLDGLRDRLNAHTVSLRRLLQLGEDTQVATGNAQASALFAETAELTRTRLLRHEEAAQKRAAVLRDLANMEADIAEAETEAASAEKAVAVHEEQWKLFLAGVGLPTDRDPDIALSDLETLLSVAADVDVVAAMEKTLSQSEQRISDFGRLLQETLHACGRAVPASPTGWHEAIDTLADDLVAQRDDAERRKDLQAQKAELAQQEGEAAAELSVIESRLQDFVTRLELSSIAELQAAAQRAADLRETSTALANVHKTLPAGQALVLLREQSKETSAEELADELAKLEREIEDLDTARTDWLRQRTERQGVLNALNGSGDAASAEAEAAQIHADLAENAEEFLRLEAAKLAIRACVEEYRSSDQETVLAQASAIFAELSLGRYTGLELSDDERPSIRAKTSTGPLLTPAALSEGTRDQLYLAMRLATLERHAAAGNALPIAVDDIFMTFDERRTEAALRILNSMADRFQIIVFTHHEHVIQSAAKELPEGRCHVHQLPN